MFERHKGGEKAILVQINFPENEGIKELQEFSELAFAAGAIILDTIVGMRKIPDAKFFIGLGKSIILADTVGFISNLPQMVDGC